MKSRQSHKPRGKRKKAALLASASCIPATGHVGRQSNLFATGVMGKYGFWRNNYLGLLALIFNKKGPLNKKELAALTDTSAQAWVIQLQLQLNNLQHPESASLITKKQTIRQLQQLLANSGYQLPSPKTSELPAKQAGTMKAHQQQFEPTRNPSKNTGTKSGFVNNVNKGSSPLIQRSIGQIAASIGMLANSRKSSADAQLHKVSGPQHTSLSANFQLKRIQLSHKSVTSNAKVVNHVKAFGNTSQWLEQFQEGKPSAGALVTTEPKLSPIRPQPAKELSFLQEAGLLMHQVIGQQMRPTSSLSNQQDQLIAGINIEAVTGRMTLARSAHKGLPKLGEGPFSEGAAPATVQFIKSLLARHIAEEAAPSPVNAMRQEVPISDDSKASGISAKSSARGFLKGSHRPSAIQAASLTSTLPFAMQSAATRPPASRESSQSTTQVWRKQIEQANDPKGQVQSQQQDHLEVRARVQEELLEQVQRSTLLREEHIREQQRIQEQSSMNLQEQLQNLHERSEEQETQRQQAQAWEVRRQEAQAQEVQAQEVRRQEEQKPAIQVQELRGQEVQKQEIQAQEVRRQEEQKQEIQAQEVRRQEEQKQEIQAQEVRRQEEHKQEIQAQEVRRQEAQKEEIQAQEVRRQEAQKQEKQAQEVRRQEEQKQEIQAQEVRRQEEHKQEIQAQEVRREETSEQDKRSDEVQGTERQKQREEHQQLLRLQETERATTRPLLRAVSKKEQVQGLVMGSLIHRKSSVTENGVDTARKIQSNEQLLQQLVQKPRQRSSNDSLVRSTYTDLIGKPELFSKDSKMIGRNPRGRQPLTQTGSLTLGDIQSKSLSSVISANGSEASSQKVIPTSPSEGYLASVQASKVVQEAQRLFRTASNLNHNEDFQAPKVRSGEDSQSLSSEISAKMAENSLGKAISTTPAQGSRAGGIARDFAQEAERLFRSSAKRDGQQESQEIVDRRQTVSQNENQRLPSSSNNTDAIDLSAEILAKVAQNGLQPIDDPSPFVGYRAGLQASSHLQDVGRVFRKAAGTEKRDVEGQKQQLFHEEPQSGYVIPSVKSTPTSLADEIAARAAVSSMNKTASSFSIADDVEVHAGHKASRRSGRLGPNIQGNELRKAYLADDSSSRTRSNPAANNLAAEIAAKTAESSLRKISPSLVTEVRSLSLQRRLPNDQEITPSTVQTARRRAPKGQTEESATEAASTTRLAAEDQHLPQTILEKNNEKANQQTANTAVEVVRGTMSRSPVEIIRRTAEPTRAEQVRQRLKQGQASLVSLVGRTSFTNRPGENEVGSKLPTEAARARRSKRPSGEEVWRGAQVEHLQRQANAAEQEREHRKEQGSENLLEAEGLQTDWVERTIRARVSALEEERAQGAQPAAASRAAEPAGGARAALAPMARQPVSMTPRVMPLLASSAGALRAAPAGLAAASPAAAATQLSARGTGSLTQAAWPKAAAASTAAGAQRSASMTHSSSPSLAAAITAKPLSTQVQRQAQNAGASSQGALGSGVIGSSITQARQDYAASQQQPSMLEHKQAQAAPIEQSALAVAPLEMDWLRAKASADQAQAPAAPVLEAAPKLTEEQLQELIKELPQLDIAKIADKVYREIEKKMKFERQRRGL
ncbi:hypothetical protein BC351_19790 [Paenibacillus ferrarius]|uniref:Uncharacterized protein n=1 Tax=Paenibacillus ferrarius TaxID=1469647 RepID=A0A1V4HP58_9BACL|nr:hypothetical protein [Paenibacillus ferrarius]OPH59725.1 hypothetical protein BC351_19790 [Paenibacillus ferrarius]